MTFSLSAHLARRAVEAAPSLQLQDGHSQLPDEIRDRLSSPKYMTILVGTVLTYVALSFFAEYTIRFVIGNLAIVEDTNPSDAKAPEDEKTKLLELADTESARTGGLAQPITTKIRSALRHLRRIDGFKSYFRGFRTFALYSLLYSILNALLCAMFGFFPIGMFIANVITAVITSRLHCAWTHATIRAPRSRQPQPESEHGYTEEGSVLYVSREDSRHLVLPAIRVEIAMGVAHFATRSAFLFSRSRVQDCNPQMASTIPLALLPVLVLLLTMLLLVVPAMIARIRTEAALLPESEQTIVPIDRSFGGRVELRTPLSRRDYVRRQLTLPGAWLSFDCSAYRRVLRVWIKYNFIMVALGMAMAVSLATELYVMLGDLVTAEMVRDAMDEVKKARGASCAI